MKTTLSVSTLLALIALSLLTGCTPKDPPVDPKTQPSPVVVNGKQAPSEGAYYMNKMKQQGGGNQMPGGR